MGGVGVVKVSLSDLESFEDSKEFGFHGCEGPEEFECFA